MLPPLAIVSICVISPTISKGIGDHYGLSLFRTPTCNPTRPLSLCEGTGVGVSHNVAYQPRRVPRAVGWMRLFDARWCRRDSRGAH